MDALLWLLPLLFALVGLALLRRAREDRRMTGVPEGKVIYTDTREWEEPPAPFLSRRYGLVGRPDYLVVVREGSGEVTIPIEVKSGKRPREPHAGHVLQLATYCLLIEDQLDQRPPYGLLRYADATLEIEFSDGLRREVLAVADEIRQARHAGEVDRQHEEPGRCRNCGYRVACGEQALV